MADFMEVAGRVLQESWQALFASSLAYSETPPVVGDGVCWLTASVDLVGERETYVVHVSSLFSEFAQVAAKSLGMTPETIPEELVQDLLGEIGNQVCGQIKSNLDAGGFNMSLPSLVYGRDYRLRVRGSESLFVLAFHCESAPVVLELIHAPIDRDSSDMIAGG